MSGKTKEYSLEVRGRAISMIEAGMKQKTVAEAVGMSLRTIEYWWSSYKKSGSFEKKKRSGRPKILGRIEKIVISKSTGKKRQSCRKFSKRMKAENLQGSKDTEPLSPQRTWHESLSQKESSQAYRKEHKGQDGILQEGKELDP